MLVSPHFAILENPRCGAGALAACYGAERLSGLDAYATTSEARDAAGESWRSVPIILPVRDPVRRFLSAIRAHAAKQDSVQSDEVLALETLALLQNGFPEDRRDLWPQVRWMTAAVDHVLPLPSLHQFVSQHQPPRRVLVTDPSHQGAMQLSKQTVEDVRRIYAEDVARFATLPVYPSAEGRIWLMSGRCIPCEQTAAVTTKIKQSKQTKPTA
jgi:hypothetical protein